MRADILADDLLRLALGGERAAAVVLGHTRWASIGIISQPNAHPVDSHELDLVDGPYVTAALNGDVDNFADLKSADGLRVAAEITTDAKVIPTLVSRRLAEGADLTDAFRDTVAGFEGSVAIGASAASSPDAPAVRAARAAARRSTSGWPTGATSWRPSPTASSS